MAQVIEYEITDPIEHLIDLSTTLEEHHKAYKELPFSQAQKEAILTMIDEFEGRIERLLPEIDLKKTDKSTRTKVVETLHRLSKIVKPKLREKIDKTIKKLELPQN